MHFDFTISPLTILFNGVVLGALWKILRLISLQKDYPPHRHVNGKIIYPKDYAPEQAQSMSAGGD